MLDARRGPPSEVLQLGGTAVLCRVLPKVKPPCTYSLLSIRAQIAALKMSMVLQASEMLADASIVPAFIRMCGATFGHGCAMGLQAGTIEHMPCFMSMRVQMSVPVLFASLLPCQVTLPETLVVGKGCFFATGNILTSVDVDQGKFNVPCITYMSRPAAGRRGTVSAPIELELGFTLLGKNLGSEAITPSWEITTTCRRVCPRAASVEWAPGCRRDRRNPT